MKGKSLIIDRMEKQMANSYRYFENRECKYYPCHETDNINCLFCYCPLYSKEHCPGTYKYLEVKGKKIKECSDCTFPHKEENYEVIMKFLESSC